MGDGFRPGTSLHAIIWMSLLTVVALSFAMDHLFKSDTEFQSSQDLAKHISQRINIKTVRVLHKGKRSDDPVDRLLKVSLYLSAKQYDDENVRTKLMDKAFKNSLYFRTIQPGTVEIVAKKQTRGGCHPTFDHTSKSYENPLYTHALAPLKTQRSRTRKIRSK